MIAATWCAIGSMLNEGWDAVFGSRFMKGGGVIDYPWLKLSRQPPGQFLHPRVCSTSRLNDTTNAFKAYRAHGHRRLPAAAFAALQSHRRNAA